MLTYTKVVGWAVMSYQALGYTGARFGHLCAWGCWAGQMFELVNLAVSESDDPLFEQMPHTRKEMCASMAHLFACAVDATTASRLLPLLH